MIKISLISLLSVASSSFLCANDDLVIPIKREIYHTQKDVIKSSQIMGYFNLLNPVVFTTGLTHSDSFGGQTETTYQEFSFSQDIFRSGGLFKALEHNIKSRAVFDLELDINFNILKRNIFIITKRIQAINLDIASTELYLQNAIIDFERKNEQYTNGVLDFSFVNTSIIERERTFNSIIDLKRQKNELEYQLSIISDKEHNSIKETELTFPSYYDFFKDSRLLLDEEKIKLQTVYNQLVFTKYLPRVTAFASTRRSETEGFINQFPDSSSVGVRLTIPLHPNIFFENEANRKSLLKSKSELVNSRSELERKYYLQKSNYKLLDQKITHLTTMIQATTNLLTLNQEQFENGLINKFDLEMSKNTAQIYQLSLLKVKVEKDLIILNLLLDMRSN